MGDSKSDELYFRLFRTGIIGDLLFKNGKKYVRKERESENQFLAALFESYLFLIRTIYDYLLHYLKVNYGVQERSFNNFIKKIKKGHYPEIKGRLRTHLVNNSFFEEVRALRDSIKEKTPHVYIYVKNNRYWVKGTIFDRNGNRKESFNQTLYYKMFAYSAGLLILMTFIVENMTGVSFKDQLNMLKSEFL